MNELDRIKKSRTLSLNMVFLCLAFLVITIYVVIKIFNQEQLSFTSYKMELLKAEAKKLEQKIEGIEKENTSSKGHFYYKANISRYNGISGRQFLRAREDVSFAETLFIVHSDSLCDIKKNIDAFNTKYCDYQFYSSEFSNVYWIFAPYQLWRMGAEGYEYNKVKEDVLLYLKYNNIETDFNLVTILEEFNLNIEKMLSDNRTKIKLLKSEKLRLEEEIIKEEERLERVSSRQTYILISKAITITMALVILMTLLSLLRYFINLFNRYQMQLIVLEQLENNGDVEVSKLLLATNFQYDNRAEEMINFLVRNTLNR